MADNNVMGNDGASPRVGSTLSLLAGVWLMASPFVFGYTTAAMMRDGVITGIIVAVLAIVGLTIASETWSRWLNILAGIWLILSAAAYSFAESPVLIWNNVIVGVLIIAFSSWSMNAVRHRERQHFAT